MSLQEEIIALAFTLHGAQDRQLETLCPAAEQMLAARLRKGVSIDDCRDCFMTACALLSIAMLESIVSGGLESMDMGTLNLCFGAEATRLRDLALQLIAPWTHDGFAFQGVRA